jgi:alcohol dehydrogenase
MTQAYFEFFCPVKIVAGFSALEHLAYELRARGSERPLLLSDRGVRAAGLVSLVEEALGSAGMHPAHVFDDVPQDSSTQVVTAVAHAYRQAGSDAIVALGGGSVIDTAKASNILVSEGGDDLRAYAGTGALSRRLKPLFVLPTTSGTGSEVTNAAVIRDAERDVKLPFVSQFLLPDVALLDPRLTLALPPLFTAATAMDAMTHAVEAYLCLAKNPLSDAYALKAIEKIASNLGPVLDEPKNRERRLELALAATMAGIAFSNSMVGLVHALGHAVGAIAHVPHGVCMSVLLPFVLEHNLEARRSAIGELLAPLAGLEVYARTPSDARPAAAIARLRGLRDMLWDRAKLPRTLGETGRVTREMLPHIARLALDDGSLIMNPVEVDPRAALHVLERAY